MTTIIIIGAIVLLFIFAILFRNGNVLMFIAKNVNASYMALRETGKLTEEQCLFYAGSSQILHYLKDGTIKSSKVWECVEYSKYPCIQLGFSSLDEPLIGSKRISRLQRFIQNLLAAVVQVDNPAMSTNEILNAIKNLEPQINEALQSNNSESLEDMQLKIKAALTSFPLEKA